MIKTISNEALIFQIKRYSINDGPGIRITIFLKACPLNCAWCHNPEGIKPYANRLYTANRCIACGACIAICPNGAIKKGKESLLIDNSLCVSCGKCANVCPARAMEMAGKLMSVKQIMEEIRKEEAFFDSSGGGVTFCGGEPLMHPDFLFKILDACAIEKYHRAIDTSLYASANVVEAASKKSDLFLVDLKLMDSALHKKYTGVSNELILSNFKLLARLGANMNVRIPLIEGVNADLNNLKASAAFLADINKIYRWQNMSGTKTIAVEFLPYHSVAAAKHTRLGTTYNPNAYAMSEPSQAKIKTAKEIMRSYGVEVKE